MRLRFLDFDPSEDTDGHGTFDAMATVGPAQWAALQAEVAQVLAWAQTHFPAGPAPLDDGGDWDCLLQGLEAREQPLTVDLDPASGALRTAPQGPAQLRHTLTLTLTGTPAFCAAFEAWCQDGSDADTAPRRSRR